MTKRDVSHLVVWLGMALMLGACDLLDKLGEEKEEEAQASATIGAEGGTLQAPGIVLVVPPGALSQEVELSVEKVPAPQVERLTAVSPVFRFGPSGLQFDSPVTVTFDFQAAGSSVPKLYWSKPGDEAAFDEVGGTVEGSRLHGQVSHFSVGFVAVTSTSGGGGGDVTPEESCEARCRKRESLSCLPSQGRDYDNCMEVCAQKFDEYPAMNGDACVAALIKENMCIAERWECENGLPTTDRCQMEEHWIQAWCFMGKGPDSACEPMELPGEDPFPCPESHPIKSFCYGETPDKN